MWLKYGNMQFASFAQKDGSPYMDRRKGFLSSKQRQIETCILATE